MTETETWQDIVRRQETMTPPASKALALEIVGWMLEHHQEHTTLTRRTWEVPTVFDAINVVEAVRESVRVSCGSFWCEEVGGRGVVIAESGNPNFGCATQPAEPPTNP